MNRLPCPHLLGATLALGLGIAISGHTLAATPIDFRTLGADPSGHADSGPALEKAFALPGANTVYLPPGHYRIACGHSFSTHQALSLIGASQAQSVLRLDKGCTLGGDLMTWNGVGGWRLQDFTLDLDTPATPARRVNAVALYAYNADAPAPLINRVSILHGTSPMLVLALASAGGHDIDKPVITSSTFSLTAPALTQNQCVALTTNGGKGRIDDAVVSYNTCLNTGLQIDGARPQVIGNDISNWEFGTGIFTAFTNGATAPSSDHDCLFVDNVMHDALDRRLDVNRTPHNGVENNCYNSVYRHNLVHHVAGAGFYSFANNSTFIDNLAYDNGAVGAVLGPLPQAGFVISRAPSGPLYQARNTVFIGNRAYDDGTGTQLYGYHEEGGGIAFGAVLRDNDFEGSVAATVIAPGPRPLPQP